MKKVTDTIRRNFKPVLGLALFLSAIFVLSFVPGNGLTEGAVATAIRPSVDSTAATVDTAAIRDDSTAIPGFRGRVGIVDVRRLPVLPPQELKKIDNETLWLARCIYSETKRPEEQELVAWVVRNRVETGYRGNDSYKEAVLDPYQFSAFIEGTKTREHYGSLTVDSKVPGWQKALTIAKTVRELPAQHRPFSRNTRHFYSEQSMVDGRTPDWAKDGKVVKPERDFELEARRFRFYVGVS
jgi:hypothetical protein